MSLFVVSKERWSAINSEARYGYDKIDTTCFVVSESAGVVSITTSAKLLFDQGVIQEEDISKKIFRLGGLLLQKDAISDIEIHKEDITALAVEVKKLDILARTIKVSADLSIACDHPEFRRINYEFLAWSQYPEDSKHKLVHPFNWRRDSDVLKRHDFTLSFSEAQLKKIEQLEAEEGAMARKAYFFKSQNGYRVLIYELHNDIIKMLANKCKFNYNKAVKGKMETVELVFVKAEMLDEVETENPEDLDKIVPLMKAGYRSFTCFMFTLPAVKLSFRKNGITYEGDEKLVSHFPDFSFTMPKPKLWDIQENALAKWKENEYLGTVALPTGSGKTHIGAGAIQMMGGQLTVVVAPTVELVFQWKARLVSLGVPADKIGVYYGGQKELEGKEIIIITFQSGHRKISEEVEDLSGGDALDEEETELVGEIISLSEKAKLLILDEGHHAPAPVFQRIMVGVKSPYRLSLTATPYREDKNDVLAFMAMGDVVYTEPYDVLAEKGYVSPIDYRRELCELDSAEQEVFELQSSLRIMRENEWSRGSSQVQEKTNELAALGPQLKVNELAEELLGDYLTGCNPDNLAEGEKPKMPSPSVILNFSAAKFAKLLDIAKKGGKIIVFNQRVKGAELIFEYLKHNGFIQSVLITGATSNNERRIALDLFSKSPHGILISTTVLDEGIDVPDANVIVVFNGTNSKRQMIQRVGRGCRFQKGKVETVYELVSTPQSDKAFTALDEAIITRTIAELKKTPWAREVNITDYQLMNRYGVDEEQLAQRQLLLTERIRSAYRNIDDTVNPEKMKALIAKTKRIEVKAIAHSENWTETLEKLGAISRAQRLSRSADPKTEGIASVTWNWAIKTPKAMLTNVPYQYRSKEDKDSILVEVMADGSLVLSKTTLTKLSAKQKKTTALASISWNGEVIIPKSIREVTTLRYKDEVSLKIVDGKVEVKKLASASSSNGGAN